MASQMKQIKAIKEAIKKEDISELRALSIKHGFINDKLRKKAWPVVLGIKTIQKHKMQMQMQNNNKTKKLIINNTKKNIELKKKQKQNTKNTLQHEQKQKQTNKLLQIPSLKIDTKLPEISESKTDTILSDNSILLNENNIINDNINIINDRIGGLTPEYQQIEKDIKRSSLSFYNIKKGKKKSEASLSKILHLIFDDNESLHYIQGFNDVTSVFYAVCNNEKLAQKISETVAKTLLRDYIVINENENEQHKADNLNIASYKLIFDIIECHDSSLNKLFINGTNNMSTNGNDFISISISWLITWFAHHIKDINIISRIYDYCLCSNDKLISSYLCAALLIYLKNDLFLAQKHSISLFEYFNDLKWNKLDFNKVIQLSQYLYIKYSNDLNKKFKQFNEKLIYIKNDSDSTDSPPVPITPYTPWTPFTSPNTPIGIGHGGHADEDSAFDSVDFDSLKKSSNRNTNNNNSKSRNTKMEFKKKIKGFIDDYFGTYNDENE